MPLACGGQPNAIAKLLGGHRVAHRIMTRVLKYIERVELERISGADEACPIVARFVRLLFLSQVQIEVGCIGEDDVVAGVCKPIGGVFTAPTPDVVTTIDDW